MGVLIWPVPTSANCAVSMALAWLLGLFAIGGCLAVEIQGHRGARGHWPESTAAGFSGALAMGVDVLELDLGLTGDDVPVVNHDPRLSPDLVRDANGRWLKPPGPTLRMMKWADLAGYDLGMARPGSRVARRFPGQRGMDGQRVLRLADVFALVQSANATSVRFNIELKSRPDATGLYPDPIRFARAVSAEIAASGMGQRVTIQSFDWRTLVAMRSANPSIPLVALTAEQDWLDNIQRGKSGPSPWTAGLDVDDYQGSVPRLVKALGAAVWSPYFGDLQAGDVTLAHRLGLLVSVWTVNDRRDIEHVLNLGVDSIISDYPDRVRVALAERGLSLPPRMPQSGSN